MRIQAAELTDFRNIAHAKLRFSEGLNAFVGANGQGKTNLVEGLYTLASLRPLRPVPRGHLIREGADRASVRVDVLHERRGIVDTLGIVLDRRTRSLEKNGKPSETRDFIGQLVVVAFTPDDLQLSKGGPDLRRRFLDRAILNTRPAYLDVALRYQRALKSRNKLLVDDGDDRLLEVYDDAVATHGAELATARAQWVARLGPRVAAAFARITGPTPSLKVRYRSSLGERLLRHDPPATARALRAALEERRKRDRARRSTSLGPHLDDLELVLDGANARVRASQGQHRAMVLAIKLAEIEHLTELLGEPPVLLLDDISSELDHLRSAQLFEAVAALEAQVVLTTTDEAQVPRELAGGRHPVRVFDVEGGVLRPRDAAA